MNWRNIKYTIMQNHGAGQRNLDTKKKKKKKEPIILYAIRTPARQK
jgi:hypothetical protein